MVSSALDRLGLHGASLILLVLLLLADAACIVLYGWNYLNGSPHFHLKLSAESGWAEFLQHVKQMWFVVLLLALWWLGRSAVVLGWAALGTVYLLDDALRWHERFGALGHREGWQLLGLGRGALWEAVFVLGWVGLLGTLIAVLHRSTTGSDRLLSKRLTVLFVALGVAGVGVDAVHVFFDDIRYVNAAFIIAEDGGELVVMSFLVATAFAALLARSGSLSWQNAVRTEG